MAEVRVVGVEPRRLAAVRRVVMRGEVSRELIGGLDVVWAFIRARSIPFGHNVALYSGLPDGRLEVECGVEVMAPFEPAGEVRAIETPSGTAARATHVGPVERIGETYGEIGRFVRGLPAGAAGRSWEVYGESTDDPSAFETDIYVLLTERPRTGGRAGLALRVWRQSGGNALDLHFETDLEVLGDRTAADDRRH